MGCALASDACYNLGQMTAAFKWDAFISHASEDKPFVEPLADELRKHGLEIWLDTLTLSVGDSLRRSIDEGLAKSRFGIVILSPAFFAKQWPQHELDGLVALEMEGRKVILPVWHELEKSDLLKFSPTLADKVAAKSKEGTIAVAKALIKVIRPEALTIPTSCKDASLAITRLREQLEQNAPEFEYRIAPADVISTAPLRGQPDSNKKLIGSAVTDGMRIDVIAPNAAAYDARPLFAHATLTKAAVERLQEAHRTGDSVTFGPDEVSDLKSELFKIAGMPSQSNSIESLTISPSADVLARRLPLRVTFVKDDLKEVFSLIEFRFTKAGTEQFQVESCHPLLPFQLTITLPWQKGRGTLNVAFKYEGHDIRRVCQTHRALRILFTGGRIELTDLENDRHLGTLRDLRTATVIENPWFDEFICNVYEIAETLKVPIRYTRPTVQDAENVAILHQVVRTGDLSIPAESVGLNFTPDQLRIAQDGFASGNGLHMQFQIAPDFAQVFGQSFDLGQYDMFLSVSALTPETASPGNETILVKVTLAKPIVYRFPRFLHDKN